MGKAIFELRRQEATKNNVSVIENEIASRADNEFDALLCKDVVCREVDGTSVLVGKEMLKRLPHIVEDFAPSPQIAIIYLSDVAHIARKLSVAMSHAGWRVYEMSMPDEAKLTEQNKLLLSVPEYIRFIIAIGSGRISELCALVAKKQNIDFGIYATAPSTDSYISAVKAPKFVVADELELQSCPKQLVAAGVGIVLSQPLKEFERRIESLLFETIYSGQIGKNASKIRAKRIMLEDGTVDVIELFWQLVDLSKQNKRQSFVASAEILADILARADGKRYFGEYVFVASYLIAGFYSAYLSGDCSDVLLPPDKVKTMKLLEKKCGFNYFSLVKRIDILSINSYFRIKYILSEYRKDLLDELSDLNFKSAQKFWRRQYADAGFWLSNTFCVKELLSLMSLSGELAGGLLGFAKASGALENYI